MIMYAQIISLIIILKSPVIFGHWELKYEVFAHITAIVMTFYPQGTRLQSVLMAYWFLRMTVLTLSSLSLLLSSSSTTIATAILDL